MNNEFWILIIIAGPLIAYFIIWAASRKQLNRADISRKWSNVKTIASSDNPQFAVVEADKVFDSVLKQLGFKGETMGDRLKSASTSLKNENNVWTAHKLRNKIVHESDAQFSKTDIKSAISSFEKALKGLGAL